MRILRATILLVGAIMLLALAACESTSITVAATATATIVPPGATTVPHPIGAAVTRPLVTIDMFTTINGWGTAQGATSSQPQQLTYTSDGGHTWVNITPDGLTVPSGASISYVAQSLTAAWVYVAGNSAGTSTTLWHTTDAGTTWNSSTVAATGITQVDFVDAQHGWLIATATNAAGQASGAVWRTTNGGASWAIATASPPVSGTALGISFLTTTVGFATASAASAQLNLAVTHDSGMTWQPVKLSPPTADFATAHATNIMPPVFTSATTGALPVVYWSDPTKAHLVMYRTSDAGATWDFSSTLDAQGPPSGSIQALPISVAPDGTIFAVPMPANGAIFHLSPISATWVPITTSAAATALLPTLTNLDMLTTTTGWAVTQAGVIATTDGGVTWTKLYAGA